MTYVKFDSCAQTNRVYVLLLANGALSVGGTGLFGRLYLYPWVAERLELYRSVSGAVYYVISV